MDAGGPYPLLEIDLKKLAHNAREVLGRCGRAGIGVAAVVKGFAAQPAMARVLQESGAAQLATSRLRHIRNMRQAGLEGPFMLLRVPMQSELGELAELADYSLHSDWDTLKALQEVCRRRKRRHKVVIMVDLGDLREGFYDGREAVEACLAVEEELDWLELAGLGTNLGCYGAIRPTVEKMEDLLRLARQVEEGLGRKLEMISGGATSSYALVHQGIMPAGINHLRIGEGISVAYDLPVDWGMRDMDYLFRDVYTLKAQLVEVRRKPSLPQGETCIDAFGNVPVFRDRGWRLRALAAIGRADLGDVSKLLPRMKGVEVLGGSSDHAILDIEEAEEPLAVGDVLSFDMNYTTQVFLMASEDVTKRWIE